MKIGNIEIKKSKSRDTVFLTNLDGVKVEVPRFTMEIALEIIFVNAELAED